MTKQKIKYISFYNHINEKTNRVSALSAINKIDYVIESLNILDYDVELISPSWLTKDNNKKFISTKLNKVGRNTFIYTPSFRPINTMFSIITIFLSWTWLILYLLRKCYKNEKVIVYHSLWLIFPIWIVKKIKNISVILEIEEIYSDVVDSHKKFSKCEHEFLNIADSYIFSTKLLNDKINLNNKPNITLYGIYKNNIISNKKYSKKIKILYAGIIDSYKKGAFNAIQIAPYLNEKYEIHIVGFGEVDKLINEINKINQISLCKVSYDGLKSGYEFNQYCQDFTIGLSTQTMEGEYLDTSFPSKILTYLSFGLIVISGRIKCVEKSKVINYVKFYDDFNPKQIAEVIINTSITNKVNVLEDLNKEFLLNLKYIISNENF